MDLNYRSKLKSFQTNQPDQKTNFVPEHCSDVTLADFEQIIKNDLTQLEAELLNDINYFSRESNKFGIIVA